MVELVAPHHFSRGDGPPSWVPHAEAVPAEGVWHVSVPAGPTVDQLLAHALSAGWSVHRVDPGTLGAALPPRSHQQTKLPRDPGPAHDCARPVLVLSRPSLTGLAGSLSCLRSPVLGRRCHRRWYQRQLAPRRSPPTPPSCCLWPSGSLWLWGTARIPFKQPLPSPPSAARRGCAWPSCWWRTSGACCCLSFQWCWPGRQQAHPLLAPPWRVSRPT